jgi:Na+(H+)/acetate symporter ActP
MKETLKKTFNLQVLAVVGVVLGIILTFEFLIFPGLTASDTILNIISLLLGIFSILFAFHFIQWKKLFDFLSDEEEETIEPGETELDYVPKEEVKKKRVYKKKEQHVVHPKVKKK